MIVVVPIVALLAVLAARDTVSATAVATIIATAITGGVALATQKSAAKAAVRNQTVASRTDIETEAFNRAKAYYTDTIDRQDREIHELEGKVGALEGKVDDQAAKLRVQDETIADLRRDLDVANRALKIRFPDE